MRARYGPILALALVPTALLAAPPEAPPKLDGQPGRPVLFEVKVEAGKRLGWAPGFDKNRCPVVRLHSDDPAVMQFMALPDAGGEYRLTWWTEGEIKFSQTVITVGGAPPPPGPVDPPKPVDPPQPQADAPIPGDGLRVMLVFDRLKLGTMSEEQKAVVYGRDVRDYLRAKAPKGPDGVTPEARFWPTDTDAAAESKLWQDAFARAKSKAGTEPLWLIISNGKTGFEGKPPATVAEMLTLLKKYGGS